jgi:hypothetical protein
MGRLFVVADAPWGKVIHNLGSLTLQSFITSFGPRSMNNFGPPIRDYRTQPGVLTPGIRSKTIRPERAADSWERRLVWLAFYLSEEVIPPPFQGGTLFYRHLGLKPQLSPIVPLGQRAESCPQNRCHINAFLRRRGRERFRQQRRSSVPSVDGVPWRAVYSFHGQNRNRI